MISPILSELKALHVYNVSTKAAILSKYQSESISNCQNERKRIKAYLYQQPDSNERNDNKNRIKNDLNCSEGRSSEIVTVFLTE